MVAYVIISHSKGNSDITTLKPYWTKGQHRRIIMHMGGINGFI